LIILVKISKWIL